MKASATRASLLGHQRYTVGFPTPAVAATDSMLRLSEPHVLQQYPGAAQDRTPGLLAARAAPRSVGGPLSLNLTKPYFLISREMRRYYQLRARLPRKNEIFLDKCGTTILHYRHFVISLRLRNQNSCMDGTLSLHSAWRLKEKALSRFRMLSFGIALNSATLMNANAFAPNMSL